MTTASAPLEVRSLTKRFAVGTAVRREYVYAVDDVSFDLHPGKITALVGESGSGKTTVARLLARLYDPSAGAVIFDGGDVSRARRRRDILRYRSQVQMIFQDPFGSLNPVKTIRHHVERPLRIHRVVPSSQIEERGYELLHTVGLVPPREIAEKDARARYTKVSGSAVNATPAQSAGTMRWMRTAIAWSPAATPSWRR